MIVRVALRDGPVVVKTAVSRGRRTIVVIGDDLCADGLQPAWPQRPAPDDLLVSYAPRPCTVRASVVRAPQLRHLRRFDAVPARAVAHGTSRRRLRRSRFVRPRRGRRIRVISVSVAVIAVLTAVAYGLGGGRRTDNGARAPEPHSVQALSSGADAPDGTTAQPLRADGAGPSVSLPPGRFVAAVFSLLAPGEVLESLALEGERIGVTVIGPGASSVAQRIASLPGVEIVRTATRTIDDRERVTIRASIAQPADAPRSRDLEPWTAVVAGSSPARATVAEIADELRLRGGRLRFEVDVDTAARRCRVATAAPATDLAGWLLDVDAIIERRGAILATFTIGAGPDGTVRTALEIVAATAASGRETGRVAGAIVEQWPVAARPLIVAGLGAMSAAAGVIESAHVVSPSETRTAAETWAASTEPHEVGATTRPPVFVGTVATAGRTVYAFRIEDADALVTLEIGSEQMGWRLLDAAPNGFELEFEGGERAFVRDSATTP